MSLFSATNKYGLQMALFLPTLLLCDDFRLDAELRWGPKREPRTFHLEVERRPGLAPGRHRHLRPGRAGAFLDRFRQVAPAWEVSESTEVIELGREGVWVPDYRFVHKATGDRRLRRGPRLLEAFEPRPPAPAPARHGPPRYLLAISDRLKVDEETLGDLSGPVLRFKEIPNAPELAALLDKFLPSSGGLTLG